MGRSLSEAVKPPRPTQLNPMRTTFASEAIHYAAGAAGVLLEADNDSAISTSVLLALASQHAPPTTSEYSMKRKTDI